VNPSFELDSVDRITVGTVGPVGQRTFLLQARSGVELVTLKIEKEQVRELARSLGTMLADLPAVGHLPDQMELEEPTDALWTVGTMQLGYDTSIDRVIFVAEEAVFVDLDEEDEDQLEDPDVAVARFSATREQVAALAIRGTALVEAGRPPCPLCGHPLDPRGHTCPRTNGNRPPTR
jgi:uncharacterized repeat protein (TIGR03847 family)